MARHQHATRKFEVQISLHDRSQHKVKVARDVTDVHVKGFTVHSGQGGGGSLQGKGRGELGLGASGKKPREEII